MRSGLKVTQTPAGEHGDRAAMSAALNRLYGAATETVREITAYRISPGGARGERFHVSLPAAGQKDS